MKIELITLPDCPPCREAKRLLDQTGLPYETPERGSVRRDELRAKTNYRSAPLLFIDDEFVAASWAASKYIREKLGK